MVEWIKMRERALIQFRNGSVSYLITTDLAVVWIFPKWIMLSTIICLQKRMSSHIETVERHVCYLQERLHYRSWEWEKWNTSLWDGRFKLESASLPKPPEFQTIYKWWEEK
jgi:superfamily II DNA/RNA helicase